MPDVVPAAEPPAGLDGYLFGPGRAAAATPGVGERWLAAIEERRRACRGVRAGYHAMAAPDREAVYADKLAAPGSPGRPAARMGGAVIDPAPGLRARRRIAETYARTGAGWTDYGAYAASCELIEALRGALPIAPPPQASLEFWEEDMIGDLAAAAGRAEDGFEPAPEIALRILHDGAHGYRRVFGRSDRSGGGVQVFENPEASLPRALGFAARGPAGAALTRMLPFLCPCFSRLTAVASPDLFLDLIESEQPDAVFELLADADLAREPAPTRRGFEAWSGARLPLRADPAAVVIDFSGAGNADPMLGEGWSSGEAEHRWSLGEASTLVVPRRPRGVAHDLLLDLSPCVFPPELPRQRLGIEADGEPVGAFEIAGAARIEVEIPARAAAELTLRFLHPDFVTPALAGRGDDDRPLAFCFGRLELRPKPRA